MYHAMVIRHEAVEPCWGREEESRAVAPGYTGLGVVAAVSLRDLSERGRERGESA